MIATSLNLEVSAMIYNDFQDLKLSALGLGCMRFPVVDGNEALIDETATAELFDYAMAHGINYYDTAWGYHVGNSETVTGKLLQKYPRDSYYLASKFPGYDPANLEKKEQEVADKNNSSDAYVKLARASLESYILRREKMKIPEDLPEENIQHRKC